jgi:RNA polymerase sigma-54 factor
LELRQGQALVMTPQLQQAIKLLQMSNIELQDFVEAELERNPLLERDERVEAAATAERQVAEPDAVQEITAEGATADKLRVLESDSDNVGSLQSRAVAGTGDSGWASLRPSGGVSLDGGEFDVTATLARSETLAEHLTDQLNLALADPADRLIGQHLIGMANEAGYLTADLAAIAASLGTDEGHVERVLAVLQGFDPPGVLARDLKECLSLQLREANRLDPAMAALIANLDRLARRDYGALRSLCGVDAEDLRDMIAEIKRLNPKPGHAFGAEPVQPVIPDVIVRAASDGSWIVELNGDTLPRVLVNNPYLATVSKATARDEDKLFLNECHANATWLVRSLDQRARTILKVAREIVRQQDAFLVLGVQQLRPLTLRTVADATELHESTVSRVTSNKYVATPRGTFEMKYFFTTAIASSLEEGESHSAEAVRHRIKELVGKEGPAILSDDAIVAALRRSGVEIARRTVAKYRESLGIPSSVQRRREARAQGGRGG